MSVKCGRLAAAHSLPHEAAADRDHRGGDRAIAEIERSAMFRTVNRSKATPVYNAGDRWLPKSRAPPFGFWSLMFAQRAESQDSALRQAARLDAEQKCGEAEHFYRTGAGARAAVARAIE